MTFPLEPLGGMVIVEQDDPEEVSRGGVLFAQTGRRKPLRGRVVAAGPGYRNPTGAVEPMPVVAGDMVLFGWQNAGEEIEHEGKSYRVLHCHALLAILKWEPKSEEKGGSQRRRTVRQKPDGD